MADMTPEEIYAFIRAHQPADILDRVPPTMPGDAVIEVNGEEITATSGE